jgi:Flp pilus assembly protein TadD
MLNTIKYLRGIAGIIMGIAILVLVMLAAGCGKSTQTDDIIVRLPQKNTTGKLTRPAPTPVDTVTHTEPEPVVVAVTPEPVREVTYEEAEAAFNERRYEEAVELFTRYTERKSGNPWGYYMLGLSGRRTGDTDVAERAFGQALDLDPQHVKSLLNLSRVLLDTDRADVALARIGEALAIDSRSGDGYRLQGRAFRQLADKNQAAASYRLAIQIDDEDAWSMNNLALMFIEEGRYDDALPPLARAVELRNDVAVFLNNLGMALEGKGHYRAAEEAYRTAVAIDSFHVYAATNLARIELVSEDPALEPVNLAVLAQSFVDEVAGWQAMAHGEECEDGVDHDHVVTNVVDPVVSDGDSIVVSDAETIGEGEHE